MTASLTLVIVMAVVYAAGVYVMLERSLTRVLIGFLLVGNATNILIFIMSGPSGSAPIVSDTTSDAPMVDPVPQVLMLTAIVINFGITAFLLALIYRSWWLARLGDQGDTVPDEHKGETEQSTDAAFDAVDQDDKAIQDILDASDEHATEADAHKGDER
ncbi:multisubunit sodium/proton antiporter, MrpC subunit [Paramicrobacterium humi]|uniref:Multisubunit sodium/proton antiporter, MrpC subunit n=1 Tax=Paramicrobacterium humi TaxID=640635 RepID=A0A1H4IVL3_9MICO|nr:NADH-quinone oxidoreductase subunit K [Microbacterium humi]SEB38161.1 multisubunit sodium/proton antiporter, MrpC subunit [Microbacterium humi]